MLEMKPFAELTAVLNDAQADYQAIQDHFAAFARDAMRFNENDSPVRGLKITDEGGSTLLVEFLDRRIRISRRFSLGGGALWVDDVTVPDRPAHLTSVRYFTTGETEIPGSRTSTVFKLDSVGDCKELLLRFVELALEKDAVSP
jgi:hypothetical protein